MRKRHVFIILRLWILIWTENGSPRAKIETDEDRTYFLLTLPVHERALQLTPVIGVSDGGQKNEQKNEQKIGRLYEIIKDNPRITRLEIARILGISESAAQRLIKKLRDKNRIVRVGGDRGGYWQCND